jgi:hypothetical protein
MRRKEKEIKDPAEIEDVLKKGMFCRVGLSDKDTPYVVPVCYGYENGALYFHCAKEGRKLDILRKNSHVCAEISTDTEIVRNDTACHWSLKYRSVIGFGKAFILEDEGEKRQGLSIILRHYGSNDPEFQAGMIKKTVVVKVVIENITGKKAGYPSP